MERAGAEVTSCLSFTRTCPFRCVLRFAVFAFMRASIRRIRVDAFCASPLRCPGLLTEHGWDQEGGGGGVPEGVAVGADGGFLRVQAAERRRRGPRRFGEESRAQQRAAKDTGRVKRLVRSSGGEDKHA